jgi:hypothetical protein
MPFKRQSASLASLLPRYQSDQHLLVHQQHVSSYQAAINKAAKWVDWHITLRSKQVMCTGSTCAGGFPGPKPHGERTIGSRQRSGDRWGGAMVGGWGRSWPRAWLTHESGCCTVLSGATMMLPLCGGASYTHARECKKTSALCEMDALPG